MASSIQKQRHRAAVKQAHHCYYCSMPMWEANPAEFSEKHQITLGQTNLLQCTGEHLHPKSEGGPNSSKNIVAACKYCNQTRHKAKAPLTADRYKQRVQSLSKTGKWHTAKIVKNARHSTSKNAK